jgi:hypothetical protein
MQKKKKIQIQAKNFFIIYENLIIHIILLGFKYKDSVKMRKIE